jgi:uncharacterized sodium:solute symporter family permease YidK
MPLLDHSLAELTSGPHKRILALTTLMDYLLEVTIEVVVSGTILLNLCSQVDSTLQLRHLYSTTLAAVWGLSGTLAIVTGGLRIRTLSV